MSVLQPPTAVLQALLPELASFGASMPGHLTSASGRITVNRGAQALTFNVWAIWAMTWLANSGWSIHCRRNCAMP